VFGYKGKQVRDNLDSADLVAAFDAVVAAPRSGEVYNIGGGRGCHCSMLEAIAAAERIAGRALSYTIDPRARRGDHIWYISDTTKFRHHYPTWQPRGGVEQLLEEIHAANASRWMEAVRP